MEMHPAGVDAIGPVDHLVYAGNSAIPDSILAHCSYLFCFVYS